MSVKHQPRSGYGSGCTLMPSLGCVPFKMLLHFSRRFGVGWPQTFQRSRGIPWEAYALQCVHPSSSAPSWHLKYLGECPKEVSLILLSL